MGGFKENAGKNIARYRNLYGLSQEQLSHDAGIARDNISKIESGTSNMKLETLEKLCKFFDVTPNDILLPRDKDTESCAEAGTGKTKKLSEAERLILVRLKLKELNYLVNDEAEE